MIAHTVSHESTNWRDKMKIRFQLSAKSALTANSEMTDGVHHFAFRIWSSWYYCQVNSTTLEGHYETLKCPVCGRGVGVVYAPEVQRFFDPWPEVQCYEQHSTATGTECPMSVRPISYPKVDDRTLWAV